MYFALINEVFVPLKEILFLYYGTKDGNWA